MTLENPFESTLVLVRHGQSEHNANNLHAGWLDSPLTVKGIGQALAAGRLIKDQNIQLHHVFASDLQRAYITAEQILEVLEQEQLSVFQESSIKERHCGIYEGVERDLSRSFLKDPDVRPEGAGGESINDLCDGRIGSFVHETLIPILKQQQNILVTAHNQSIRAMMMVLIKDLSLTGLEHVYGMEIPNSVPCIFRFRKMLDIAEAQFEILGDDMKSN